MDKITVFLEDIADALDASSDSWDQYLNTKTGEIIPLFAPDPVRSPGDDAAGAEQALAEEVFLSHHYIRLPGHLEISELDFMKSFVRACEDQMLRQQLEKALARLMPCVSFRHHLTDLGRIDEYHDWRLKSLLQKAVHWCERHGIPFRTRVEGLEVLKEPDRTAFVKKQGTKFAAMP